jgi:hypothetical protein
MAVVGIGTFPTPFLPASVPLPLETGGRWHTSLRVGGWGGVPIPTRGIHYGTLYMYVLCDPGFRRSGTFLQNLIPEFVQILVVFERKHIIVKQLRRYRVNFRLNMHLVRYLRYSFYNKELRSKHLPTHFNFVS